MAFATRTTGAAAAGGGGGGTAALQSNRSMASDDVVFHVGAHRQTYHVNSECLIRSSAYFRNLLNGPPAPSPPIVIDCEEGIFERLLLLMRYGTLKAVPSMSSAQLFRLKKEADFYGIHYTEQCATSKVEIASHSDDCSSDLSCSNASCSSPSCSPKSMVNIMSPPAVSCASKRSAHGGYHEGIRITCTTPRQLAELPEFPVDLADPARLVLVSCLDQEKASIYTCDCFATSNSRHSARIAAQWAINFHHRHAFCTACGLAPNLSPKHFAEMFTAAATNYYAQGSSRGQAALKVANCKWRAYSDSTCMLRFIRSAGDGPDACGCSAGGGLAAKEAQPTIWAASCYYSHAFCTCCGEVATGPVLLSLILAVRYGGSNFSNGSRSAPSSFSMDSHATHPHSTTSL